MKPLRVAAFLVASGFVAGVTQVLLIRELLLACFGNEISLGLMLAAWLICGAVGALWARRWKPSEHPLGQTASRALKLAVLVVPAIFLAIVFARMYPSLAGDIPMKLAEVFEGNPKLERFFTVYIAIQPGEMLGPIHLVLISFGTALLPAIVEGALFAVGLRAYEQAQLSGRGAAGHAYGLDAIGHLIGGVLLGWAALMVFNSFVVSCVAGGVLWIALVGVVQQAWPSRRWLLWAGVLLIPLLISSNRLHRLTSDARWHGRELLGEVSSLYGHMAVAKQGEEGVVFFENGVPTGLSPALPSVQQLVQFAMLQHLDPDRVLLIGGGATGGLLEVLKHDPEHADYAELDPALLRFAEEWVTGPDREALRDPRVTRLAMDGRLLVKQVAAGVRPRYDVIISLLPDPSTALLNRFYTQEWFREARAALNPGGVLAWEMSSSRHYFRESLLLLNSSILGAAESVFPRRALMTGDDTLAIAVGDADAALSDDLATLEGRLSDRHVEAPSFSAVARDRLEPYNKEYVLKELGKSPPVAPNQDLVPVGYFYDQAVWIGFYYPDLETLYVRLARLRLQDLWRPGLVLLVLLALGGLHRAGRSGYVPLAILVTGAVGMALEMCLIFAFQAFYGYVYHQVGVIIGAFMVGLAGGAIGVAVRARRLTNLRAASWALVGAQLLMALLALALPLVLRGLGGGGGNAPSPLMATLAFPLITAIIGLGVGAQFPLAAEAVREARSKPERSGPGELPGAEHAEPGQARAAAGLYAADLVGASLGALGAGALLIPVLGIPQTCTAAAMVGGAMTLLLMIRAVFAR